MERNSALHEAVQLLLPHSEGNTGHSCSSHGAVRVTHSQAQRAVWVPVVELSGLDGELLPRGAQVVVHGLKKCGWYVSKDEVLY